MANATLLVRMNYWDAQESTEGEGTDSMSLGAHLVSPIAVCYLYLE